MSNSINIGGKKIEYTTNEFSTDFNFHIVGKLRWQISDEWGWAFSVAKIRDMKLNEILGSDNKLVKVDYSLMLNKRGEDGWGQYTIFYHPYKNLLRLRGEVLNVDLKCDSFKKAEELADMLIEGNNLTLMPISDAYDPISIASKKNV